MSARPTPTFSDGAAFAGAASARAASASAATVAPSSAMEERRRIDSAPPQAGARGYQLGSAALARLDVEDRLVARVAGEEALVGDDQPAAEEHRARGSV